MIGILRDAQKANIGLYPQGEIRVRIDLTSISKSRKLQTMEVHSIWQNDNLRSKVSTIDFDESSQNKTTKQDNDPDIINYVLTPDRLLIYSEERETLQIEPRSQSRDPYSYVTPADCWFGKVFGEEDDWLTMLEPTNIKEAIKSEKLRLKQLDNDNVELTLILENGVTLAHTFSLKLQGNVLSQTVKGNDINDHTEYKWKMNDKGRAVLENSICHLASQDLLIKYTVLYFDPDYKPNPKGFTLEDLSIKSGTMVTDNVSQRVYRYGDKKVSTVIDSLDGLAEKTRRIGFARPERR